MVLPVNRENSMHDKIAGERETFGAPGYLNSDPLRIRSQATRGGCDSEGLAVWTVFVPLGNHRSLIEAMAQQLIRQDCNDNLDNLVDLITGLKGVQVISTQTHTNRSEAWAEGEFEHLVPI